MEAQQAFSEQGDTMLAGYARVSTLDQNPELQIDALKAAGCGRIFEDRASGTRTDRPGLAEALDWMHRGDTLVVWRLDRLGKEPAAAGGDGQAARGGGVRLPLSHRGDRHHHRQRHARLPCLRGAGPVRAGSDQGADHGRPCPRRGPAAGGEGGRAS